MTTIQQTVVSAEELKPRISIPLLKSAYKRGMNFSRFLETLDPSDKRYDNTVYAGTDAFQRQLMVRGIQTRTDVERGFYADKFEAFVEKSEDVSKDAPVLSTEYISRVYRSVKHAKAPQMRALLGSDIGGVGSALVPYVTAAQERAEQIAPAIPIAELVARTTAIRGQHYQAIYIDDVTPDEARLVRVGQGAEIPAAIMFEGEHAVHLYKYGRRIDTTYEVIRHVDIDKVGFHVAQFANQAEADKVVAIMDVMINGDGNANTAARNVTSTSLDPLATGGAMTVLAWIAYQLEWENPYALTTILYQKNIALKVLMLQMPNSNVPLVTVGAQFGLGAVRPINPDQTGDIRAGVTADAPASKIVGFDRRWAIERITEIGADIVETERFIKNQTETIVLSEVEGYAVLDKNSVIVLQVM